MVRPSDAQTIPQPSKIEIISPSNNLAYNSTNVLFNVAVGLPTNSTTIYTYIWSISYKLDYQSNYTTIYHSGTTDFWYRFDSRLTNPRNSMFTYSTNLTDLPEGNHSITVKVVSGYGYLGTNPSDVNPHLMSESTNYFTASSSTNSQSSTTPTLPPGTISNDSIVIILSIVVATLVISVISLLLYVRHLKRRKP